VVARRLLCLPLVVPVSHGILPMPLEMDDELGMHGDNERAPLASLGWAAEYLFRVLLTVSRR
jgi:hypothetical protein